MTLFHLFTRTVWHSGFWGWAMWYPSLKKAQKEFDEKQAQKLQKKIKSDKFDLNDFYDQIQKIKKMGNVADLVGMIPGAGKALQDADLDEDSFKTD